MKNLIFIITSLLAVSCVDINKHDHQTPATAKEVTINRYMQRVVRYDCQGRITSNKIEQVEAASELFYISSNTTEDLLAFKAVNETTGSSKGSIEYEQGVFTLDLEEETQEMKAVEGVNKISWAFIYCAQKDEANKCLQKEIRESGVSYLNIQMADILLKGKTKVKCQK